MSNPSLTQKTRKFWCPTFTWFQGCKRQELRTVAFSGVWSSGSEGDGYECAGQVFRCACADSWCGQTRLLSGKALSRTLTAVWGLLCGNFAPVIYIYLVTKQFVPFETATSTGNIQLPEGSQETRADVELEADGRASSVPAVVDDILGSQLRAGGRPWIWPLEVEGTLYPSDFWCPRHVAWATSIGP